jgi:hypothetical protein
VLHRDRGAALGLARRRGRHWIGRIGRVRGGDWEGLNGTVAVGEQQEVGDRVEWERETGRRRRDLSAGKARPRWNIAVAERG